MIPFTNPDTQMAALTRPLGCAEQLNSVHAASIRAEGRRRGVFGRRRH